MSRNRLYALFSNTRLVNDWVVYIAATGNDAPDAKYYIPARYDNVITVSSIVDSNRECGSNGSSTLYGSDDRFASFSNYGSVVDIAAPGVNIYSTYMNDTHITLSGTSMAAPHVTGTAIYYTR